MRKLSFAAILLSLIIVAVCFAGCTEEAQSATDPAATGPISEPTGEAGSDPDNTTPNSTPSSTPDSSSSTPTDTTPSSTPATTPDSTPDTTPDTTPETKPEVPSVDPEELTAAQQSAYAWCNSAYDAAKNSQTLSAGTDTKKIASDWSKVYSVVSREMYRYYNEYLTQELSYEKFECLMKSFANISTAKGLAEGYINIAASKKPALDAYALAKSSVDAGKYMKATKALAQLDRADFTAMTNAKALVFANIDNVRKGVTEAVTEFMVRYDIADGKKYLENLKGLGIDEHIETEAARLEEYRKFQDEGLVKVNLLDTLENIYTHCLIAFPEINFASKSSYSACGPDCLTPYEFTYLLESLYERGYIIIDANLVYNAEGDKPNYTLMLPEGKKPLIFTFDDVTYDSRKDNRGMIDKLIVDEDGYVCTYTKHKDGSEEIRYDNELFPILDAFIRKHPDFTFRGARGTLFFTGFDGICGYRTQSEPVDAAEAALKLDRQAEIASAKVVIEALREEGWNFGCHGFNHSHMPRLSAASFRREIDMWREEVGAIVGDTGLFCWPYGDHTYEGVNLRKNAQHKYLFDSGFFFFFGCGSGRYLSNELDGLGIFSDRKGVTGQALLYIAAEYRTYVRDYPYLFDTEKIWDPLRLPYKDWLLSKL